MIHPGVRVQVEIDLLLMKAGSWLLQCLPGMKWLSLCEVVDEFEKLMTKQVGTDAIFLQLTIVLNGACC